MKPCIICKVTKPAAEFYKHPEMADGRVNKCKECYRECVRLNRIRRMDYYIAYDRSRAGDRNRRRAARYGLTQNHEHTFASRMVNRAVASGLITKPSKCSVCKRTPGVDTGAGRHIEGHHRDYNKPLSVIWLCRSCHRREHAEGPKPIPLKK